MNCDILKKSLTNLNFKLYKSQPMGNCFFNSIAKYFRLNDKMNITGKEVRLNLIKFITTNEHIMKYMETTLAMSNKDIHDELYELRNNGVYDLDIFDIIPIIIATQYNIKVCIYTWMICSENLLNESDCEIYVPITDYDTNINKIHLLYSNMEHYDLLFPL